MYLILFISPGKCRICTSIHSLFPRVSLAVHLANLQAFLLYSAVKIQTDSKSGNSRVFVSQGEDKAGYLSGCWSSLVCECGSIRLAEVHHVSWQWKILRKIIVNENLLDNVLKRSYSSSRQTGGF